jgi:hypothetical protein
MIRRCVDSDFPAIGAIINDAAQKYRGAIPADRWHDPYMSDDALRAERRRRLFWGWEEAGALEGVMGIQQ